MTAGAAALQGPQTGQGAPSPQLGQLLGAQAAPPNPHTADDRSDPNEGWKLRVEQVKAVLREGLEKFSDSIDPQEIAIGKATYDAFAQLSKNTGAPIVAARFSATLSKMVAPTLSMQLDSIANTLSAPPIAPGAGGLPGMGLSPPPGLPGLGAPTAGPDPGAMAPPPGPPGLSMPSMPPVSPPIAGG